MLEEIKQDRILSRYDPTIPRNNVKGWRNL